MDDTTKFFIYIIFVLVVALITAICSLKKSGFKICLLSVIVGLLVLVLVCFFKCDDDCLIANIISNRYAKLLIFYLLSIFILSIPVGIVIRLILTKLKVGSSSESDQNNNGTYIGYLERLIIFTLFFSGIELTINNDLAFAITSVLGIKTAVRFKEFSNDDLSSEYYLIGTFLSLFLTIIVSVFVFMLIQ